MTTPSEPQFLTSVLAELAEPLYSSLDKAAEVARSHFESYGMVEPVYGAGASHLARAHARRLLIAQQDLGAMGQWVVAPPAPNVQICLNRGQLQMRLLRPDRSQPPKPGTNPARIAWFSNNHQTLSGIESSRLIGLWSLDENGLVVVRVVRTVGEARWGQKNKIDVDIPVPRGASALNQLEFRPMDDHEVRLPFEDDDEGTGSQGAGQP